LRLWASWVATIWGGLTPSGLTSVQHKILIMGLPGAGKTTLARALAPRINAVWFNGDEIRDNVNKDLGFSQADRLEQARRMGWLCDKVAAAGHVAIADFVCPTHETRKAFGDAFLIWVDRIAEGRFADTNRLFEPPSQYNLRVTADGAPRLWVDRIVARLRDDAPKLSVIRAGEILEAV